MKDNIRGEKKGVGERGEENQEESVSQLAA